MMIPILTMRQVTKSFLLAAPGLFRRRREAVAALDQITLDVYKGDTVSIVGESGCGKTTLAQTAAMVIAPDTGSVRFKGRDLASVREKEKLAIRQQIHLVFQDPSSSLNPRLNAGEIIAEPLRIHKIGAKGHQKERVAEVISEVGLLPSDINKYPHQFSGGQRQRIALARALILRPELIIADEPLSALDVSTQSQIINLMAKLKKDHDLTYIFISHNLHVVSHVSDRVFVMHQGRIIESADTESLFQNPHHPYTKLLLSAAPSLLGKQRGHAKVPYYDSEGSLQVKEGCQFSYRCPKVEEICGLEAPQLRGIPSGPKNHLSACHFPEVI